MDLESFEVTVAQEFSSMIMNLMALEVALSLIGVWRNICAQEKKETCQGK